LAAVAESHIEEATLAWVGELGFAAKAGPDIGPRLFARQTRAHLNVEVKDLRPPEAARLWRVREFKVQMRFFVAMR